MTLKDAEEKIVREITKWNGVIASPHRFGGTEFRLRSREIGHVHGNHQADIPFPISVRNQLIADGKAEPHHIIPQSGWITYRFKKEGYRIGHQAIQTVIRLRKQTNHQTRIKRTTQPGQNRIPVSTLILRQLRNLNYDIRNLAIITRH